jgi:hypothetical protein
MARGANAKSIGISRATAEIFSHYYPNNKIAAVIIRGDEHSPLLATWLEKTSELQLTKMKTFDRFIQAELSLELNYYLLSNLNSEIIKMYRPG